MLDQAVDGRAEPGPTRLECRRRMSGSILEGCIAYYYTVVWLRSSFTSRGRTPLTHEATLVLHPPLRLRRAALWHGDPGRREGAQRRRRAPLAGDAVRLA